jgi:uncharacterized membrane protein
VEYFGLVFVHVFFAILWAGGAIAVGLFIIPSVIEAGPAGGAVMAGVLKRRFPLVMTVSGVLVVLSGLRMYMLRFDPAWVHTPEGIVLSLGAIAGLGAMGIGMFIQKPTVEKLGALGAKLAAAGRPPTPEETAEMDALRRKLVRVARLTAFHLAAAALLMASHRLAALM